MNRSIPQSIRAVIAMLLVLAISAGLDRAIDFLREENSRTAQYSLIIGPIYTLAHLLLAVLLIALFAWIALRGYAQRWAEWLYLLIGLWISTYPAVYFTPIGRFWLSVPFFVGARSFLISAGAFLAVIGAAALLRSRWLPSGPTAGPQD